MRWAWDPDKAATNAAKHGVAFDLAPRFDWESALEVEDDRYDYGERRWRAIGPIDGRLHVLVYSIRDDLIRVISLRKANEREARLHARFRST
ncbi:MAG: BrnT family toxin [Rhodobacteraceae bacterium]|nr:MAG: BrnT family toxin [Paracoccaceae bacterium]